jgi:hypothetical protein
MCVGLAAQIHESGTLVLDLSKPVPREEELNVMPGASIGGIAGRQLSHGFTLPLVLDLQSIFPQPVKAGEEFTVVVVLRNAGGSAFQLPSSLKSAEILKQGNKGRRSFVFSLVFENPVNHHKSSVIMAGSVGSDARPSSFLTIAPGQSVRVFFKGDLNSIRNWLRGDLKQIRVRAQVSEWKFEDNRYIVESESEPLLSESTLPLDLARPN